MISSIKASEILKESAKIKTRLLKAQREIDATANVAANMLLKTARQQLGYDEPASSGKQLTDKRITSKTTVLTPKVLADVMPITKRCAQTTESSRKAITDILKHKDGRLLAVVGPCSIHEPKAALEYAEHVRRWRKLFGDRLEVIMRAYIEKPRTELGWKGFIYDPLLDGTDDINLGLVATRLLACKITDMGVPIAVERLNALTPQYLNALVAYDVIGARNTTDQKAREYASATSSPVGFKNTPEGSIQSAIQAIVSAGGQHAYLGIDINGATKQVNTAGNDTGHVILRGDNKGPNYSAEHIGKTKQALAAKHLPQSIVVDASHGNSGKKAENQKQVINDICRQVAHGEEAICGVMVESNLIAGNQNLDNPKDLTYGRSITDECVDATVTEAMLARLADAVSARAKAK